jgi:YfiH family protein
VSASGPEAAAFLQPAWPAPPGVQALMTLRAGGVSAAPFDSFNLSLGVGDDAATVQVNRARFLAHMGARPTWLRQLHGASVLHIDADTPEHPPESYDAAWTRERGRACMVGAADCMPVLFASQDGAAVGAAHAGWRGLAGGVVEATLRAICEGQGLVPADVLVWLGPCIGPRQFEVGADVLQAFGQDPRQPDPALFLSRPRPDGTHRWLANLPALALRRLQAAGVQRVSVAGDCTVEDPSRFFSFRRDGRTGRMVAAIWRS